MQHCAGTMGAWQINLFVPVCLNLWAITLSFPQSSRKSHPGVKAHGLSFQVRLISVTYDLRRHLINKTPQRNFCSFSSLDATPAAADSSSCPVCPAQRDTQQVLHLHDQNTTQQTTATGPQLFHPWLNPQRTCQLITTTPKQPYSSTDW